MMLVSFDIYETFKRVAIIYPSVFRRWGRSSGDITKLRDNSKDNTTDRTSTQTLTG